MARVRLESVSKRYDSAPRPVLPPLDLEVPSGQLAVLVGPSGCGKSTTLRIVAGLEAPTTGTVRIGERDVTDLPPSDRDIAMVFQSYALYPHMTVFENMAFGLRMRATAEREIRTRVEAVADSLGLRDYLQRLPKALSGGQRQRVAIGRAVVREPKVFLFDEPLSNLDAKLRGDMRREIARVHRAAGATSLYVTHDQVEAMTLADLIVVMRDGVIQQQGAPDAIYQRPANRFVAGFFGTPSMSFLPAELADGGGDGLTARGAGFAVPVQATAPATARRGDGKVVLGVRPEAVALAAHGQAVPMPAEVTLREVLGSEIILHLASAAGELTARAAADHPGRPGDHVTAFLDPAALHWFDAATEARL